MKSYTAIRDQMRPGVTGYVIAQTQHAYLVWYPSIKRRQWIAKWQARACGGRPRKNRRTA